MVRVCTTIGRTGHTFIEEISSRLYVCDGKRLGIVSREVLRALKQLNMVKSKADKPEVCSRNLWNVFHFTTRQDIRHISYFCRYVAYEI